MIAALGLVAGLAKLWPRIRLALLLGGMAAAVFAGWAAYGHAYQSGHRAGTAEVAAAWDKERLAQQEAAREQEESFNKRAQDAQNAATEKEKALRTELAAASRATGGLRDTVARLKHKLSSYPACPSTEAALAAAELLSECAGEYRDMAERAERHAADAAMMLSACPWGSPAQIGLHD